MNFQHIHCLDQTPFNNTFFANIIKTIPSGLYYNCFMLEVTDSKFKKFTEA